LLADCWRNWTQRQPRAGSVDADVLVPV